MAMKVCMHRVYLEEATHSLIQVEGRNICLAIELPWRSNQRSISCIPEGTYRLGNRYSERFKEHIEVKGVPDRSHILFHSANNAKRDLRGCIAPVSEILSPGWGARSRIAMNKLLMQLQSELPLGEVTLTIQQATEETILQIIKNQKL